MLLSSLSIGNHGWIQILNFIVTGSLLLFFSRGLKQAFSHSKVKLRGPLLIGLVGIGLIGAGIFVTDPLFGYPANKPLVLRQYTLHGHLHDAFSMLVFICLPWACFIFRKHIITMGEHAWAAYSSFTGYAMIATFVFASMGFRQIPGLVEIAGVFQRLCVASGLTWIALLAIHLLNLNSSDKGVYQNTGAK